MAGLGFEILGLIEGSVGVGRRRREQKMRRLLIKNIAQIATPKGTTLRKGSQMGEITCIQNGAIYIEDETIRYVGTMEEILPKVLEDDFVTLDATGKCAVPGFVDSHTHFIFGGYRPEEFIMRLKGAGYLDIMKMGGGIWASVQATREAGEKELLELGRKRLRKMLSQGVTTVEGKSGYGLDLITEQKQLQVMKKLEREQPVSIVSTYLGAHAVPLEYKGREDAYIDYMIETVLPVIKEKELAEFCDVFCEEGVFSISQSEKLLQAAKEQGFSVKLHADEIITLGGGELAVTLGAASADHLLAVSEEGIRRLADAMTTATLLPCTAFCLDKPYAKARTMIDAGCGIALASDFNPGSCFAGSIPLIFALAVIHMKMTIEEALCAMTLNGAAALNRSALIGSIEEGKQADLNLLEYPDYKFLVYHTDAQIIDTVIKKGEIVYGDRCENL